MSPNKRSTDNLLRRYLNGALTAPEEAELERRARTDEPLAEAMRGLQSHPEADHASRVARMLQGAQAQVPGKVGGARVRPLRRNYARFAAAASVLLLFVSCALWFLPQWIEMAPGDMAMKTPTKAPISEEAVSSPETNLEESAGAIVASPEPKTAPTSTAPSSPTPNLRPRPKRESAAPINTESATEAKARQRALEQAKRAQSARLESAKKDRRAAVVAAEKERRDEEILAEEEAAIEAAPPASPAVATAPLERPKPSVKADQTTDLFESGVGMVDDAVMENRKQANYLEGRITNENGVPIPNALVRLTGLPIGERTDSSGFFRLPADAVATRFEVSHPDYEDETVDLRNQDESLQISLDRKEWQSDEARRKMTQGAASSVIILDKKPGYAAPLEGYGTLRKRVEAGKPADVPKGKVKFSFTVNTDGTLTDFEFRGKPDRATMDYIGKTLVQTSVWEIMQGEEPVRVYMKVVF